MQNSKNSKNQKIKKSKNQKACWHGKRCRITSKFGSEIGVETSSKFCFKHFLIRTPILDLQELFIRKIAKFKISKKACNFFVFQATKAIHAFSESSDKTVIGK